MHSTTNLPFRSALVLTAVEGESAVDKSALRSCGIRFVSTMRSGIEAARLLAAQSNRAQAADARPPADIVICSDQLDDMTGNQFLSLIKKHPSLMALPVIIMSTKATRNAVLDAIGAGCSGYVVRPYPQDKLVTQLSRAASANRLDAQMLKAQTTLNEEGFEAAIAEFTTVVKKAVPQVEKLFSEGMTHLEEQDWDAAIRAFNRAVRLNTLYAEAYLGLSKAWRGKGDIKKALSALKMAGEAYSRLEKFHQAREVFARLLKEAPDTRNPLFGTGAALIKQGNYHSAGKAFMEGVKLTPQENVHTYIARACQFTDSPEKAADQICLAIEKAGDSQLADRLHRRIVGRPVATETSGQQKLKKLSVVQEVIAVMRYTFQTYKQLQAAD